MNIFQSTYEARLQDWFQLRKSVNSLPIEQQCVTIDEWWQQCPLVTHHLHPQDIDNWPDPWELLSENTYCEVARALGMCYTLQLTERFKNSHATINVATETINKAVYYLLKIEDKVYGYADEEWVEVSKLPKSLKMQKIYEMKPLH